MVSVLPVEINSIILLPGKKINTFLSICGKFFNSVHKSSTFSIHMYRTIMEKGDGFEKAYRDDGVVRVGVVGLYAIYGGGAGDGNV